MNNSLVSILSFLIFLSHIFTSAFSLCQNDQKLALLQFKQSFEISPKYYCSEFSNGDQESYPRTNSWKGNMDCCMWDGITCDESSGDVIELDLSCSQLIGRIDSNSTLFQLSHLEKLNLAWNDFSGSFVSYKFGDLSSLTHLNLSTSEFKGRVPTNVIRLPNLVSLDLSRYFFKEITPYLEIKPSDFEFLIQNSTSKQLREIILDGILIYSVVPPNLSSLLTTLSLPSTGVQGSLPSNIFHLPNLQKLNLFGNTKLKVNFPNTKWNTSSSLAYLDLGDTSGCSPNILRHIANLSRLEHLGVANCGLSGKIPDIVLNLEHLTTLDLSRNHLEGKLSGLFMSLWRMKNLDLSSNNFTGCFPSSSITNLTQLEVLQVGNNALHGTLPSSIFNLSSLLSLNLSANNFVGTQEANMFSNLRRLVYLSLSGNNLSIVTNDKANSTSWPKNLVRLGLSSCSLTDLSFLRGLKFLEILYLPKNKIHGKIPEWAWSDWQDNLWYLNLSHNYLTSVEGIPLHSLNLIDLRHNLLEGPLPNPIPPTIVYFFASHNRLNKGLPLTLCKLSSIHILDLANNNLFGAIPQCLGNSSKFLEVLDLHNNSFHGSIPTFCTVGNQVHTLNLRGNKMEGTVPQSLARCINLEVLDLRNNNLSGTLPKWLVTLPKLQVLSLRSNKFYGTLTAPGTKHLSSQLKIIDLSHNRFTGYLPVWLFKSLTAMKSMDEARKPTSYIGDKINYYKNSLVLLVKGSELSFEKVLTVLTIIDLSSNKFEGNIPDIIGQLIALRGLNLSHNMLRGNIPHSLGKLSVLETLDLSSNQLVGGIPNELASITFLVAFNVSHNHLHGCIPKGNQFDIFENNSYQGNDDLHGYPISKGCGDGDLTLPPAQQEFPQEDDDDDDESILEGFSWKVVLLGYGCGVVFGLLMGSLMFLTRKPYWLTRFVEEEGYRLRMRAKRKRSNTHRRR